VQLNRKVVSKALISFSFPETIVSGESEKVASLSIIKNWIRLLNID
jgi:hypothetical protein